MFSHFKHTNDRAYDTGQDFHMSGMDTRPFISLGIPDRIFNRIPFSKAYRDKQKVTSGYSRLAGIGKLLRRFRQKAPDRTHSFSTTLK